MLEPDCLEWLPGEPEGGVQGLLTFEKVGAGFDPPRTHLHNRTRSISHTMSFILNNVESHRSN